MSRKNVIKLKSNKKAERSWLHRSIKYTLLINIISFLSLHPADTRGNMPFESPENITVIALFANGTIFARNTKGQSLRASCLNSGKCYSALLSNGQINEREITRERYQWLRNLHREHPHSITIHQHH